ncbi:hypothetical protein [Cellulomonas persica]|uniref:Uncharacterized protein n=1 Tax=Cellulomonas persica TaxID=76861 RepID=A0A510USF2_9CELL|nr:hypothetical protein [Cellulomonas persica]GEK17594.1 hypothetical protein CPE01_13270 [Cellulomonas persica]
MSQAEVAFRYAGRSGLRVERGGVHLGLATTERRTFVDGRAERADLVGAALLVVAHVAAARYDTPEGAGVRLADPFVTTGDGAVRFESLSGCGRVAARLDLLPGGLELADHPAGTTNVELGPRVRELLGGVLPRDPVRLEVGAAGQTLIPPGARLHERRVMLPAHWVRTLAELPALTAAMTVRAELGTRHARSFVRSLPADPSARQARPTRDTLRLVADTEADAARPDAVLVAAPAALRELEPLLRHANALRVWADAATGASWWELDLPHARLGVGMGLDPAGGEREAVVDHLAAAPDAATGRLGYDLHDRRWYARRIPVGRDLLEPTDRTATA